MSKEIYGGGGVKHLSAMGFGWCPIVHSRDGRARPECSDTHQETA